MFEPRLSVATAFVSVMLLMGCKGFNPVADTMSTFVSSAEPSDNYQKGLSYLKVVLNGRETSMALGYRSDKGQEVHEHWYSGQREMLHLVNGRITEVQGMTNELRKQSGKAPSWTYLMETKRPLSWLRTRDVMPGYRYGVVEYVVSQWVEPTHKQAALVKQPALWFTEQIQSKTSNGQNWTYIETYAVSGNQVIYSEQCLAPDMCIQLRPLGVMKP